MSKPTVLNSSYKGLVENFSIPVELHERDNKTFASFGGVLPIHCATPEQVSQLSSHTHHYCGVFTEELLAPLEELAYVRLDENLAEKVFINRTKRILLISSDGVLAQWRCAPTFESANKFIAGTPLVNARGQLVSVITARRGNHYAVSTLEGEGGYFETSQPWEVIPDCGPGLVYGDRVFPTREELQDHVTSLPPATVAGGEPTTPVLIAAPHPRLALITTNKRQLSHHFLPPSVLTTDIEYL